MQWQSRKLQRRTKGIWLKRNHKEENSIRKKLRNKEEMIMTMNVENMFYVRETPWHGLGKRVNEALNSKAALTEAGPMSRFSTS